MKKIIINYALLLTFLFSLIGLASAAGTIPAGQTGEAVVKSKAVETTSVNTDNTQNQVRKELAKKRKSELAKRHKMYNLKKYRQNKTTSCLKEGAKRYDCRQEIEGYSSPNLVKAKDIATLEYKGGMTDENLYNEDSQE